MSDPFLSIFSTAKPFEGEAEILQRNAITSWARLRPAVEVILIGDEPGVAEICEDLGLRHVPAVARSDFGTPLIPDLFDRGQRLAQGEVVCYVNSDIVLMEEFVEAVRKVRRWRGRGQFLAIGTRWNVPVPDPIDFSTAWEDSLRRAARESRHTGGPWALDYFVFPRGLYRRIPPFAVGRPNWDNWMVYGARSARVPVIDLSPAVTVIHQEHGYGRHPGGRTAVYGGDEAHRNAALADRWASDFGLHDSTHALTRDGVRPVWRVQGLGRHLRHELIRLPVSLPRLDGAIHRGRLLYRRLRRALMWSRPGEALARALGRRVIHCFGDRNALLFGEIRWAHPFSRTLFDVCAVDGASALGLGNGIAPEQRWWNDLAGGQRRTLLFVAGEEDCRSSEPIEEAVTAYTEFLEGVSRLGHDVIVMAVPPPLDGSADEVGERLDRARRFNAALRSWADANGCSLLDYEEQVIDPSTGEVRHGFRFHAQRNFSLDPGPWGTVVAARLRAMGFR